uniref:BRCT domain-containing protein n=1 Tax=Arion vulgaris TaxID=1028688 RepID=A0A0B7A2I6_9EUPU
MQQRLLTRYIAAFNGEVEDYMNQKVNFVVTKQHWDDNFNQAVSENPHLIFVKPTWITTCHEKNKLIPYQPYIVVP